MGLAPACAQNVFDLNAAHEERIGNERAVTAPRHRFSAHECQPVPTGELKQFLQGRFKIRSLHIIGETTEGSITPTSVW